MPHQIHRVHNAAQAALHPNIFRPFLSSSFKIQTDLKTSVFEHKKPEILKILIPET